MMHVNMERRQDPDVAAEEVVTTQVCVNGWHTSLYARLRNGKYKGKAIGCKEPCRQECQDWPKHTVVDMLKWLNEQGLLDTMVGALIAHTTKGRDE